MKFTFHKGKHRARPLYWLRWIVLLFNPIQIKRRVTFTNDSKYYLPGEDQEDWNKLFGISYSLNPHRNSARFGWRFNPDINKFQLCAYCYLNGELFIYWLADCLPNFSYDCHILITNEDYIFRVYETGSDIVKCAVAISKKHRRKVGYLLGPYFGGNRTAPFSISINLKKI